MIIIEHSSQFSLNMILLSYHVILIFPWLFTATKILEEHQIYATGYTITTFNILAAVHRSMDKDNSRESERREWWQPRAKSVGKFVAQELASSDIILLQEWWFYEEFEELFDNYTGHIFDRVSERRSGGFLSGCFSGGNNQPNHKQERVDGMAVLVNKRGKLKILNSRKVFTGPSRIAQIVHCQEREQIGGSTKKGCSQKRDFLFANAHLSFPGEPDENKNARKQAFEVIKVARALKNVGNFLFQLNSNNGNNDNISTEHIQIIAGDFNSNSSGLAAKKLANEFQFVNCAGATAEQTLCSGSGGRVNLGVTHHTHRGEDVSVDHIFARLVSTNNSNTDKMNSGYGELLPSSPRLDDLHLRSLGYLPGGVQILNTEIRNIKLQGDSIISDHRPVTAVLEWPVKPIGKDKHAGSSMETMDELPLDPLQPPWPMEY